MKKTLLAAVLFVSLMAGWTYAGDNWTPHSPSPQTTWADELSAMWQEILGLF